MAAVLDHSEKRDVFKPVLFEYRLDCRNLSLAAVEQNKIGQAAEALAALFFFLVSRESSVEHLRHGGVIVLTGKAFYHESAVAAPVGLAVPENYHARDVVAAGGVRDII